MRLIALLQFLKTNRFPYPSQAQRDDSVVAFLVGSASVMHIMLAFMVGVARVVLIMAAMDTCFSKFVVKESSFV
jgi:hypothetical protein